MNDEIALELSHIDLDDVRKANNRFSEMEPEYKLNSKDFLITILMVILFIGIIWFLIEWRKSNEEEMSAVEKPDLNDIRKASNAYQNIK